MATPTSQRVGIWIIAIVLALGTLGSFLVMALSVQNQSSEKTLMQKLAKDYQASVDKQSKELSDKYYPDFSQYASIPAVFSADGITEIVKNDIKVGDGAEITSIDTPYDAYYIGWNPTGVVFDQSISSGSLKAPLSNGSYIDGWNEGVIGMKIGGVRELTIPSDKAYGATGSGDNIPPNTPIKFIIMMVSKAETIAMPSALVKYYQAQYQTAN